MPYYKRNKSTTYRRRRIPKKYYSKSKKMVTGQSPTLLENISSGVGAVATIAKAVLPAISAINTEVKYYDQTAAVTAYTPGTNDQLINLTGNIAQGLTDNDRIGNSILAKNIALKLAFNFPATVGTPSVMGIHCRMTVFCYKNDASGEAPTVAKLYQSPTNLYSPINKDNSEQYVLLKDKFFTLESSAGITAIAGFRHMKWYKDLNWHIRWGANTDPSTNHIYVVFRSSAGVTNALGITYYSRLNFTDN